MSTREVSFDAATREQLIAFAEKHLGLTIHPATNTPTIKNKIHALWDKNHIIVDDSDPAYSTPAPKAPAVEPTEVSATDRTTPVKASKSVVNGELPSSDDPKVTLTIPKQEGPGGDRPVWVAVNGTGMFLPREQSITIPYRYLEVLRHATRRTFEQGSQAEGYPLKASEVPEHPFSIEKLPSEAEMAAWKERKRAARAAYDAAEAAKKHPAKAA